MAKIMQNHSNNCQSTIDAPPFDALRGLYFNLTNFCIWLFYITTVIQTLSFIHVQAITIISLTTMQVTNDSLTCIYSYFCNDVYLISLNRGLFWNTSDTLNVVTKKIWK